MDDAPDGEPHRLQPQPRRREGVELVQDRETLSTERLGHTDDNVARAQDLEFGHDEPGEGPLEVFRSDRVRPPHIGVEQGLAD